MIPPVSGERLACLRIVEEDTSPSPKSLARSIKLPEGTPLLADLPLCHCAGTAEAIANCLSQIREIESAQDFFTNSYVEPASEEAAIAARQRQLAHSLPRRKCADQASARIGKFMQHASIDGY